MDLRQSYGVNRVSPNKLGQALGGGVHKYSVDDTTRLKNQEMHSVLVVVMGW